MHGLQGSPPSRPDAGLHSMHMPAATAATLARASGEDMHIRMARPLLGRYAKVAIRKPESSTIHSETP